MTHFLYPLDHAHGRTDKPFKTAFLHSPRLLVGLNTLLPGQAQALHEHEGQDKFYFVLVGYGRFTVGDETHVCGPGELILAPAGIPHAATNDGEEMLSFLTVIAPAP